MLNDPILSLPYILIFAPLLLSIAFNVLKSSRTTNILAMSSLAFLSSITVKIMLSLKPNENFFVDVFNGISIAGSNYAINLKNTTIILGILVVSFFSLLNLNYETFFIRQTNPKFKRTFYSMYFLLLFSAIGALTTYNIFHLFLFIKIFNFSSINMLSAYMAKGTNTDIYKFYTNTVFGSLIMCLSIFYLFLYFNTNDALSIKQQIATMNLTDNYFIILMLLLLVIAFILSFLMFNTKMVEKDRKISFNIATMNNIFIDAALGLYLIDYFVFDIFSIQFNVYFSYTLYSILSAFMLYYSIVILFIKNNSVYNIFFNFVRINIYYCLVGMLIPDRTISSNVIILNMIENSVINLPIYLISVYLEEIYHNSNYKLLDEKKYLPMKCFLVFLILFKACLPYTTNSYSAAILTDFFMRTHNYLMLGVMLTSKALILVFLLKFFFYKKNSKVENKKFEFRRGRLDQLRLSIIFSFLIIIAFIVVFAKLNWMFAVVK